MSERTLTLAQRRSALRAHCALQREQLARAPSTRSKPRLGAVDRGINARAPLCGAADCWLSGGLALLVVIGPRRLFRWAGRGAVFVTAGNASCACCAETGTLTVGSAAAFLSGDDHGDVSHDSPRIRRSSSAAWRRLTSSTSPHSRTRTRICRPRCAPRQRSVFPQPAHCDGCARNRLRIRRRATSAIRRSGSRRPCGAP